MENSRIFCLMIPLLAFSSVTQIPIIGIPPRLYVNSALAIIDSTIYSFVEWTKTITFQMTFPLSTQSHGRLSKSIVKSFQVPE